MNLSGIELAQVDAPFWFCVKTQPKREHVAAAGVQSIAECEAFCPRLRFRKATRRGPVWFMEALFPGYIFARFRFPAVHRQISALPGVSNIVHFGSKYGIVPPETLDVLRATAGDCATIVIDPALRPGDTVEVSDGPLRGLVGVITQVVPARERVKVLLDFLGRELQAELSMPEILPVTSPRANFQNVIG